MHVQIPIRPCSEAGRGLLGESTIPVTGAAGWEMEETVLMKMSALEKVTKEEEEEKEMVKEEGEEEEEEAEEELAAAAVVKGAASTSEKKYW